MPISIKTNSLKYKNATTGNYEVINAVAEPLTYDSQAFAKGTRDGISVSSNDPAYENNSKYYRDSAMGAANRAETAAMNATQTAASAVKFTSQSLSNEQKEIARSNIGACKLDSTLEVSGAAADAKVTGDTLKNLTGRVENLEYEEIDVSTFTINPAQAENGASITSVSCNWNFNKTPVSASISIKRNNVDTYNDIKTSLAKNGTDVITGYIFSQNSTFTLKGTDAGGGSTPPQTVIKNIPLVFKNKIHYGVAGNLTVNDDLLLNKLQNHELADTREKTFTVTPTAGQYIWFACPSSFDTPIFKVRGFQGGFTKKGTFNHKNANNFTTSYQVWRSDNAGLGNTEVIVS